jgi:hypothetical protein
MGLGMARREVGSGSGTRKGDIASSIPFLIEAKNHKAVSCLPWIDQAKDQAKLGHDAPERWALVFRDPRKPEFEEVYVTIGLHEFLRLLKKNAEPMIQAPDREFSYALKNLEQAINKVQRLSKL